MQKNVWICDSNNGRRRSNRKILSFSTLKQSLRYCLRLLFFADEKVKLALNNHFPIIHLYHNLLIALLTHYLPQWHLPSQLTFGQLSKHALLATFQDNSTPFKIYNLLWQNELYAYLGVIWKFNYYFFFDNYLTVRNLQLNWSYFEFIDISFGISQWKSDPTMKLFFLTDVYNFLLSAARWKLPCTDGIIPQSFGLMHERDLNERKIIIF